MLEPAAGNDNKLFRRSIQHDFVKMLLQDLEQAGTLFESSGHHVQTQAEITAEQFLIQTITTSIHREVEKITNFMVEMDNWENKVLDSLFMIKRCISRGRQNYEYRKKMFGKLEGIFANIKKLKEEIPETITIKQVEEKSNMPSKSTNFEAGESSNAGELKNDMPIKLENVLSKLDSKVKNCLCSLAIFPENTELKKRLLVHWWIGLGFLPWSDDTRMIENEIFSYLVGECVLIPTHIRKHNGVVDSYTINPTIHKQLIDDYKGKGRIISETIEQENHLHFYKDDEDNNVKAVLNVDRKHLNAEHIIRSPTIKVVQLGKWCYPDQEVHNEGKETINDVTKRNDHTEVDGTKFLEKMGETVTYLSLRGVSRIEKLPKSVGNIRDLMVLDLKDCHNLKRLPHKPKSIIRVPPSKDNQWFKELRHLDITGCYLLDYMPKWICELSNLQVLKGAVFNGFITDQCRLKDLAKLENLIKLSIKIIHPQFLAPEDFTGLNSLNKLRILIIIWGFHETVETEIQKRGNMKDNSSIFETHGEEMPFANVVYVRGERRDEQPGINVINVDQVDVTEKQSINNARKKWNIFRSRCKISRGLNNDKMLEKEKQSKRTSSFSFPENLEKLDIRCYSNYEAPELSNAAGLKNLKRLYIRGGKLAKFRDDDSWEVEILRLRFLKYLALDWYELSRIFPKLRCVNYENCRMLKNFPKYISLWNTNSNGPFPDSNGPYNDDEEVLHQKTVPGPLPVLPGSAVELIMYWKEVAPLAENKHNIMLNLQFGNRRLFEEINRPGLDLVVVLDVSESMKEEKLAKLKTAIIHLIRYLGPSDRLSIVTFGTNAKRQCGLWLVTESSQKDLQFLIESLEANGNTNTSHGLRMGIKILEDRRVFKNRSTGIFLVSGSAQTIHFGDATQVSVGNVAVHTFGLGKDYNMEELKSIAMKSIGGSFTGIPDIDDLHGAFIRWLEFLLWYTGSDSDHVEDLTVNLSPIERFSTIEQVSVDAGQYQCSYDDANGTVTIQLGNLYVGCVRKISVDVLHSALKERRGNVLKVTYAYRHKGKSFETNPSIASVRRMDGVSMADDEQTFRDYLITACENLMLKYPDKIKDDEKKQLRQQLNSMGIQKICKKLAYVFADAVKDAAELDNKLEIVSSSLLLSFRKSFC